MKSIIKLENFKREHLKQIENNINIVFMSTLTFNKIFSPKRLNLLIELSKNKDKERNISEIAESIQRKFEVIYRDLKLFEEAGFVEMKKEGKEVIPKITGPIQLPIIQ